MSLTKQELQQLNTTNFPNNTTGYITPALLREFNSAEIDALTLQSEFDTFSSSVSTQLDNLNEFSSSLVTNFATVAQLNESSSQLQSGINGKASTGSVNTLSQSVYVQFSDQATINTNVNNTFTANNLKFNQYTQSTDLAISGKASLSQDNYFVGNQYIDGKITVDGNISASGDIRAVGNIYGANLTGSFVSSSTFNSFSSSVQSQFSASTFFSGTQYKADSSSFSSRITNIVAATGFVSTASFNAYTASTNSEITAIETFTASVSTSVGSLQTFSSSQYKSDSASFSSRIEGIDDDNVTTSSFNEYTSSTDSRLNSIQSFTASVSTSVGLLQTFSSSQYKSDSASFDSRIDNISEPIGYVTTASFNAYTSSNDTKVNNLTAQTSSYALSASVASVDIAQDGRIASLTSATASYAISSSVKTVTDSLQTQINGLATTSSVNTLSQSVDSRLDSLETAGYVTATITGSSLVTASVSQSTITFTKGDGSQFNITVADVSGSAGNFVTTSSFNSYTASQDFKNTTFATTGSNVFIGNQTISGSLFISGSEVVAGDVTASRLRVNSSTSLGGTLSVAFDTIMRGDLTVESTTPQIKLRDNGAGGFSSGYDLRVDTGSFEIYDDTHNRDVLSDFFNSASQQHTTSLTSEIIVISGSTSVTLLGNVSASIISASTINGLGDPLAFSTSVDSRLDSIETAGYVTSAITASSLITASLSGQTLTFIKGDNSTFSVNIPDVSGSTINTASFATTGSNTFVGNQTITGSVTISGSGSAFGDALLITSGRLRVDEIGNYSSGLTINGSGAGAGDFNLNGYNTSIKLPLFDPISITGDTEITGAVNITATLTASLQQGYVWVGDSTGKTVAVATSSFSGGTINTGSLVTTASFNAYTQSTNDFTASISTSVGLLQTFSGSEYKADSSSFSSRINALTGSTINTSSFATTGSNTFVGDQYVSNGVLQVATYPQTSKTWFSPTAIEAVGTQSVAYEQFVDAGGYDTFNIITTLNSGSEFRDLPSDTFVLNTWLQIPQNTGNNPAPQFKRGLGVTGSANFEELTGSLGAFSASINTRINNATGSGGSIDTGSFATTGSNTFVGDQSISGSVSIINSVNGEIDTLKILPYLSSSTFNGNRDTIVTARQSFTQNGITYEPSAQSPVNIILGSTNPTVAANSIVSGSNNIVTAGRNAATNTADIEANQSYISVFPSTRTPAYAPARITNSTINALVTITNNTVGLSSSLAAGFGGFSSFAGGAGGAITSAGIFGNATLNPNSSSVTFAQSVNAGTLTVNGNKTGAQISQSSFSISNTVNLGNTTLVDLASGSFNSGNTSYGRNLFGGVVTATNIASATASAFLSNTIAFGSNLIITGSDGTTVNNGGTAFFGRYNLNDGVINNTSNVVFAVGAGTAGNTRTPLWVGTDTTVNVTGSLRVSGTNLNINSDGAITASKILVTDSGTTAIQYNQQSTGSVAGVFNTSYGKDNLKVYQYQGQPYAFNVNLTANQANAYTGSQFEWGLQLNGSNVSLPGGGGTYFAMVSGSTTGSNGDPGADKKGLNFLETAMVLDMYADTSFRRGVFVNNGMFVSQSQGGSQRPALTVDGTSAANNRAITATGSVSITGSLTVNGTAVGAVGYGSYYTTTTNSGSVLTFLTQESSVGFENVSGSFIRTTQSGMFLVTANVSINNASSFGASEINLKKNGSTIVATTAPVYTSNSNETNMCTTTAIVSMNVNDYIEVGTVFGGGDTATAGRISITKIA
jgi:hypothetical protein